MHVYTIISFLKSNRKREKVVTQIEAYVMANLLRKAPLHIHNTQIHQELKVSLLPKYIFNFYPNQVKHLQLMVLKNEIFVVINRLLYSIRNYLNTMHLIDFNFYISKNQLHCDIIFGYSI